MRAAMGITEARCALERHCLQVMESGFDGDGWGDWVAYHLSAFTRWGEDRNVITKDMARATLRDLRDRGLARFERGLFREDGEPAGAGYRITTEGLAYLRQLEQGLQGAGPA